ncbi:sulfite exporter TauE/SafE family protein [Georgenia sp. AZ-5]|uniref:sulfite exporter TauE/SafE family protein n=1 Tax=Georgenia sp. AZ-5 TaxID=3367526 RepID=UPI003753EDDC
METLALPVIVGVVVGLVVGTLGGGGGVLTVPALVYLLDQDPHVAAASSLVIVGATSATSLLPHVRAGHVRWREGAVFAVLAVAATVGGTMLSLLLDGIVLMAGFAALLMVVAILMLRRARGGNPAPDARLFRRPAWRRALRVVLWAAVVGLLTGFFGVGGGFAVVPALTLALGFRTREAVGTSLLVIAVSSAVGLGARLGAGADVDWALVAAFAAASVLAGQLGARVSARARPQVLTAAFAVLLAAVGLLTAVQVAAELVG